VALERTARTDAARRQAEKPHEHERTDAERADDLVARLSEPCAFLLEPIDGDVMKAQGTAVPPLEAWVLPRLIALGRAAVPRLIEALTDDRWTRSVSVAGGPSKGWIRDEPYVERVADLALVALGAIAREDFSGEGRIGRRAFLRGPDASIITKGGAGAAQAKALAWWEARAKRVGRAEVGAAGDARGPRRRADAWGGRGAVRGGGGRGGGGAPRAARRGPAGTIPAPPETPGTGGAPSCAPFRLAVYAWRSRSFPRCPHEATTPTSRGAAPPEAYRIKDRQEGIRLLVAATPRGAAARGRDQDLGEGHGPAGEGPRQADLRHDQALGYWESARTSDSAEFYDLAKRYWRPSKGLGHGCGADGAALGSRSTPATPSLAEVARAHAARSRAARRRSRTRWSAAGTSRASRPGSGASRPCPRSSSS
jgi:hypothetical protein